MEQTIRLCTLSDTLHFVTLPQVPTGLEGPYMAKFKVKWSGPPSPDNNGMVSYQLKHQPSVSIPLSDGWYGTKVGQR